MKIEMTIKDQIAICELAIKTLQNNIITGLCQCLFESIKTYYKSLGYHSLATVSFANMDMINPYYIRWTSNNRWRRLYTIAKKYPGFRLEDYWFPTTYEYITTRINVLQDFIKHLKSKIDDTRKD